MVTIKDSLKLFGIAIVVCCAAFVCTLFLNYRIDLVNARDSISGEQAVKMYEAQLSTSTVVCCVCGLCLVLTSIVMLITYIKNHIDSRSKELGILKALGYSNLSIAKHYYIFGLSVFAGALLGCIGGELYMDKFYQVQNKDGYFSFEREFHIGVPALMIALSTIAFMLLSVWFAYRRVKKPVMTLLREQSGAKMRHSKKDRSPLPFLKELKRDTVKGRYSLIFFVAFSSFCFSAMVQMSMSMKTLANETMGIMILTIGLILAFMMLLLALSAVVKGSAKTAAMMRIFGYDDSDTSRAILSGYRPIAWIGFAVGTLYQFVLLKIMVEVVFKDLEDVPDYSFDFKGLCITLPVFIIAYEVIMKIYSQRIKKLTIKSVMLED